MSCSYRILGSGKGLCRELNRKLKNRKLSEKRKINREKSNFSEEEREREKTTGSIKKRAKAILLNRILRNLHKNQKLSFKEPQLTGLSPKVILNAEKNLFCKYHHKKLNKN